MNEKFRKLLKKHGVDLAVGSIEYWQNEIEMVLLEMCDEAAAEERKGCAEDYLKIMRDAVAKQLTLIERAYLVLTIWAEDYSNIDPDNQKVIDDLQKEIKRSTKELERKPNVALIK
jgi:hypothetical protein